MVCQADKNMKMMNRTCGFAWLNNVQLLSLMALFQYQYQLNSTRLGSLLAPFSIADSTSTIVPGRHSDAAGNCRDLIFYARPLFYCLWISSIVLCVWVAGVCRVEDYVTAVSCGVTMTTRYYCGGTRCVRHWLRLDVSDRRE